MRSLRLSHFSHSTARPRQSIAAQRAANLHPFKSSWGQNAYGHKRYVHAGPHEVRLNGCFAEKNMFWSEPRPPILLRFRQLRYTQWCHHLQPSVQSAVKNGSPDGAAATRVDVDQHASSAWRKMGKNLINLGNKWVWTYVESFSQWWHCMKMFISGIRITIWILNLSSCWNPPSGAPLWARGDHRLKVLWCVPLNWSRCLLNLHPHKSSILSLNILKIRGIKK